MNAILFDLDGVLYQGEQPIAGSAEVIAWVQQQHIPHIFLTNTSSRPRQMIVEKLLRMRIDVSVEQILTPAVAASEWLSQQQLSQIALYVPEATLQEFSTFENVFGATDTVDAVVVGDLGEGWSYSRLNQAFRYLMQSDSPHLIALGMTRYWKADDGLRLDVGPFVSALTMATGIEAIILGKPSAEFFNMALKQIGTDAEHCIMVGDDIRSDISAAKDAGIHGIQVKTGKFTEADLHQGIVPDAILDSIADLPEWWDNQ